MNPVAIAEKITGMMVGEDLAWLHEVSKRMSNAVEIGSYKGKSTYVLCAGCRGQVYAVDPFKWGHLFLDIDPATHEDTYLDFAENTKEFSNLTTLRMTSAEAAVSEAIPPVVDMVFIDGDHSFEAVLQDITLWNFRARKMICGHDLNIPEIEAALIKYFGKGNYQPAAHNIWFVEKEI